AVRSRDGSLYRDVELMIVADGVAHPLVLARDDLRPAPGALRAVVPIPVGGEATVDATLEFKADPSHDALSVSLVESPGERSTGGGAADAGDAAHTVSLRVEVASEGQPVFVPGVGSIADRASVSGAALLIDADPHPLAVMSPTGPVAVDAMI